MSSQSDGDLISIEHKYAVLFQLRNVFSLLNVSKTSELAEQQHPLVLLANFLSSLRLMIVCVAGMQPTPD